MFAIMTRFSNNDYQVFGDSDVYTSHVKAYTQKEISRLISTTRRTVVYWDKKLFVTGIATNRKDRVGTSIRYSLLLEGPQCEEWFGRFVALLDSGNSQKLGDELDCLCRITPDAEHLTLPEESALVVRIGNVLPEGGAFKRPESDSANEKCWIWSEFCPVFPKIEDLQKYVNSLKRLPEGTWLFSKPLGQAVKKKRLAMKKIWVSFVVVALVCVTLSIHLSDRNRDLATQIELLQKEKVELEKQSLKLQNDLNACREEIKRLKEGYKEKPNKIFNE